MATRTVVRGTARERLLEAANRLFYAEGVHTVGIDRVIEEAGVAKASLYNTFGSKDELIRAYLEGRHARTSARILRGVERHDDPRARLLAVFDAQAEMIADPLYRGCAFVSASAEAKPGSAEVQASDAYREWVRSLLTDLARAAGADDAGLLARQLHLLLDGSMLAARMDRDPTAAAVARTVASALIDAATGQLT